MQNDLKYLLFYFNLDNYLNLWQYNRIKLEIR